MKIFYTLILLCVTLALLVVPVIGETYSTGKIYPTVDDGLKDGGMNVNKTMDQLLVSTGTTVVASYSGGSNSVVRLLGAKDSGYYNTTRYGGFTFAKPARTLPNDTIISAALCLKAPSSSEDAGGVGSLSLSLVGFSPASNTSFSVSDYNKYGKIKYAPDFTRSSYGANKFNCFNLTAAGLANVSKDSYTDLAVILSNFPDNSTSGVSWAAEATSSFSWYQSAYTGTASDPYFEFTAETYSTDPTVAAFSADRTTAGYNGPIVFTDASTNTPTSWLWEFGDGNTSTDKNPIHTYAFPGTFTVNLRATNDGGFDWENKTDYITVDSHPDSFVNPYMRQVPQAKNNNGWCSGAAIFHTLSLMRMAKLNVTPSATQEPVVKDVWYNWSSYTVQSDNFPLSPYAPSVASIYWYFDPLPGDHMNLTAFGETMKAGYNLATDKITSKYIDTNYNYPQESAYLSTHRYNQVGDYTTMKGDTEAVWDALIANASDINSVPSVLIDTYGNDANDTFYTLPENGMLANVRHNPTGARDDSHWMSVVGYNRSRAEIYVVTSHESTNTPTDDYQKIEVIQKAYWTYGSIYEGWVIPHNMTINEVLVPMGVTDLTNGVPGSSYVQTNFTNPLSTAFDLTIVRVNNTVNGYAGNTSLGYNVTGLTGSTPYEISFTTCNFWYCNDTPTNITITTAAGGNIPVAAFSANNLTICQGTNTQFTDASTNNPTSWLWDFGDSNSSTDQNPLKTYDVLGLKTVNLTATNPYGSDSELKTNYINVTNCTGPAPTPTPTPTPTTPTPTPLPYAGCLFTNITGATLEENATGWNVSSGSVIFGVEIINSTEGNISFYNCGGSTLSSGSGVGDSEGGEATGALLGLIGGMIGALIIAKRGLQR